MSENIVSTAISDRLLKDDGDVVPWANKECIPLLREIRSAINDHQTVSDYAVTSASTSMTMVDETILVYTGTSGTITLPSAAESGANLARARLIINNAASGAVTIAAAVGETVNSTTATSLTFAAAALFVPDGATKWRGLGGSFRATSLATSGSLTVGGAATVTGRVSANGDQVRLSQSTELVVQGPFPVTGAHEGALFGDGVYMRFGTNQIVRIGGFDFGGGINIGFATTEALGFWGATPVTQPSAVADATGAGDVVAQLNALLARIRSTGLIAT